jgi:hypothetical protein
MKRHVGHWVLLLLALFVLVGCSSTQLAGTWTDPEYKGGSVAKVFVVGVAKDDLSRRLFEDEFVARLAAMGSAGIASYQYFSEDELRNNRDQVVAKIRELGANSVLVARSVGKRIESVVTPGRTYGSTTRDYDRYRYDNYRPSDINRRGWNDYYNNSFDIVHQPATVTEVQVVTVESNLYTLDEKLIWSAQTETMVDKPVGELIKEFVEAVSKDLGSSGLL